MFSISLRIAVLWTLLSTAPLQAADTMPSPTGSILQMFLALAVVIATLMLALRLLRKLQMRSSHTGIPLRIVGGTAIGQRERIVLVEIGPRILVLGVTPTQINKLESIERSEFPVADAEDPARSGHKADFAGRLKQFLENRSSGR